VRALWIGPGARRALREGERGAVAVVLARGGYVRLGGSGWLLLAPPRSPLGPLTLLVERLGALEPGAPARVRSGALHVGDARIELPGARLPPPAPPAPLQRTWRSAMTAAQRACPAPGGLEDGIAALRRGDVAVAAGLLAGRGPGLTPAGDDVLAGFAGWCHADGAPVTLRAPHGSPLGLAYLRCAERGELPEPARRTLDAIRAGDAPLAARRARILARWGATSGAAILTGMAAGGGTA